MKVRLWIQFLQVLQDDPSTALMRWSLRSAQQNIGAVLHTGNSEQLAAFLQREQLAGGVHTVLLLNGDEAVTRWLPVDAAERKHLSTLLPFALEASLAVDLSRVHVVTGEVSGQADTNNLSAAVVYTDMHMLRTRIDCLEQAGLEVEEVYALPALLPATGTRWTLLNEDQLCHLSAPGVVCTSVEPALLPTYLEQAKAETAGTVEINTESSSNPFALLTYPAQTAINLRHGELAAPLRIARYWQHLRLPVLAAAAAFLTTLLVTFVETWLDTQRLQTLEASIELRYRQVVPEGVLVDPARQLSAQIARLSSAGSGPALVRMLDDVAGVLVESNQVQLHSLSYNHNRAGGAPELQMGISAPATADILALGEKLTTAGWNAQAQNISRSGDTQQASLLIRGAGL